MTLRELYKHWIESLSVALYALCDSVFGNIKIIYAIKRSDQALVDSVFPNDQFKVLELVYFSDNTEELNLQVGKNKFFVFIDYSYMVDWKIEGDYCFSPDAQCLISQSEELNALPCKQFSVKHTMAYKRFVAQIIVSAYQENLDLGKQFYEKSLDYYRKRDVELSRSRRIICSSIVYIIVCYLLFLMRDYFENYIYLFPMILCSIAGSYFSIIKKVGDLSLDSSCGLFLHYSEYLSRAIIAILTGVMAFCFVQSDFTLGVLENLKSPLFSYCIFAFGAGMIDALIPTIICKSIPINDKDEEKSYTN